MQASSERMVSSVVKPGKDNYCEQSSAMPTKIGSPSIAIVNSKVPKTNGQVSPPASPEGQRVTRSRVRQQKLATKTEGASSNNDASSTNQERLVCPELAINYANTVINSRVGSLSSKQSELELKLSKLNGRLRQKQLKLAHGHARKQLDFYNQTKSTKTTDRSTLSTTDISDMEIDVTKPLPIQVDGASDKQDSIVKAERPEKLEDSFGSLDSSFQDEGDWRQIQGRLEFASRLVDDEATDCSSDEEVDTERRPNQRCENRKKEWERLRTLIGSKWAWLERRISELNKQICHLDYKMQRRPNKESSIFTTSRSVATSAPYLTLSSNGGTPLEQLHRSGVKAGGNGLHTSQFLPQLLLPTGIPGSKLQVKDLLASSSLGKNFSLYVEETENGCARTRPLERRAKRKIIRKTATRGRPKKEGIAALDPSYHPKLSLHHELPSRLLLDGPVKQILQEHSYARQPLSKRRKAASALAHLCTPRPAIKPELSSSPSPVATPSSTSSTVTKVSSRRKMYQLTHQPSPLELLGPTSPPTLSQPETPTQPPNKRRKTMTSTPSYDIDNIVIPYSMAASTRLEKLEYKEIITPRWREVDKTSTPGFRVHQIDPLQESTALDSVGEASEEEDTSDEAFVKRHDKCEQQEKKRFLNFISGGQRKKQRNSTTSTPEVLSSSSPLPLLTSKRRGFESPIPSEAELYASQYMGILPWQPREFPLGDKDTEALTNPPPPPTIVRGPISPRHFSDSQFKSRTPSIASTLATPLSSPLSTPSEETPSISPTEWMIVSTQLNNCSEKPFHGEQYVKPANGSHIVLKLTKRA